MFIPIRSDLTLALIRHRYGSVDNLVVEWEHRVATKAQRRGTHRDRNSVYRWLKQGVPAGQDTILGLAGVLDVDPVGLLSIDREYIEKRYGTERRFFRLNLPRRTPLASLWPLYAAEVDWPNHQIAKAFYGRRWHVEDFTHDATAITNVYAALTFRDHVAEEPIIPRTYHFAYRRLGVADRMWRPYGVVIGFATEVVLISEAGDYQMVERSGRPVTAETHFGSEPAEFRITSIHPFSLTLEVPSTQQNGVRFVA